MKHLSKAAERLSENYKKRKRANELKMDEQSSQKFIGARKKGLRPTSIVVGVVIGFVLSGGMIRWATWLGAPPLLQLAVGIVSWVGLGWVIQKFMEIWLLGRAAIEYSEVLRRLMAHYREETEDLRVEIAQLKRTSFDKGLGDFVQGFNQAGVEVALGGVEPFGQMAEAKLRFPATQLHKHIVDGFMEGWEEGKREAGGVITGMHEDQYRERVERQAWMWIQEMTEGKR